MTDTTDINALRKTYSNRKTPNIEEAKAEFLKYLTGPHAGSWALGPYAVTLLDQIKALEGDQVPVALSVWYGSMPESNGKENWTAILHRKGVCISEGITVDRSEYPERVRYEADRMLYLIGEIQDEPDILTYDANKRSDYVYPITAPQKPAVPDDATVLDWGERNDIKGDVSRLRCLIDDAATLPAAIEAAGGIVSTSDQRLMQDMSGIVKDGE